MDRLVSQALQLLDRGVDLMGTLKIGAPSTRRTL